MSDHFFFGTIRHESIVTVILVFCMNNKRIDLVLKYVYIYTKHLNGAISQFTMD